MENETHDLQIFDLTTAALSVMKDEYMSLEVNGIDDNKGFDACHEARMVVVKLRSKITKKALELRKAKRSEIEEYIKDNKKAEAFIVGELTPIEKHLQSQEDIVTAEKARIKAEEDRKEAERVQVRIDSICALGASFNGAEYLVLGIAVPASVIKTSPDDEFASIYSRLKATKDAEDARIKSEEDARKAETERLAKVAAEQKAERLRLEAESKKLRDELEAMAKEKQRLIDEEAARVKKIEDDKKAAEDEKNRLKELEQAKAEAAAKAVRDAEEKRLREEGERLKKIERDRIAAEKKAARAPDRVKIQTWIDMVKGVINPLPVCNHPEFVLLLRAAAHAVEEALQEAENRMEAL